MQDLCMRISCAYLCDKTSASGSCMITLYVDLLRKISASGSLHQGPVGPLVQDLCMRISCARCLRSPEPNPVLVQDWCMRIFCVRCLCQDLLGSCRTRSLSVDLLCKISLSRCLPQDPVGPLVQDLSMWISCARSLCQDVCICARFLYEDLCGSIAQDVCVKISSVGLLAQDLCMRTSCAYLCVGISASGSSLYADLLRKLSLRMSAAGSCRTTCARALHQDLLCKISLSGSLHQDLCRTTCRRLPSRLHKRNFISIPRDGHAPSPQRVTLGNQKSQLYQHFARWTRTISAEGCTSKSEIATLPAFRAMDTHDLRTVRTGRHFEIRNRIFTNILRDGHTRSPQRVALRNQKSQFHLHSAHSTRTISAEGCTSNSKKRIFTCIPRTRHARSPQKVRMSKPRFRSTAPATKS